MAKPFEKQRVRALRREGKSLREIAALVGVSKSSASLWCEDINLTDEQIYALDRHRVAGGYKGRMIGAFANKQKRLNRVAFHQSNGVNEMNLISKRDLRMICIGLYIGEGSKMARRFQFVNSNPEVIKLIIFWLECDLGVTRSDIVCRLSINESHKDRAVLVQQRWSNLIGIPLTQFSRTVFIKAANKKMYENHDIYLGVVHLDVRKSSELQYKVLGLIHGLVYNMNTTQVNRRYSSTVRTGHS